MSAIFLALAAGLDICRIRSSGMATATGSQGRDRRPDTASSECRRRLGYLDENKP